MDYRESLDWLYSTQMFGIKLGLENMHRLAVALDCNPTRKIIHVAGTNGKGSVCAMAESVARAAGCTTGLFTSPHLVHYNERIKINGTDATNIEIADGLTRIRDIVADWETHPTFFEITTALGLLLFKKHACEIILLETGMGGRLDATNIVTPAVSVLTRIDLDHAQWLGNTLQKIAAEKAGIIKPGIPAITGPQAPEVLEVFRRATPLLTILDDPCDSSSIALSGEHQKWNAALAISALQTIGVPIDSASIATGLKNVRWPGRFQQIRPGIYLDGAHNPAAAGELVKTWQTDGPAAKPTILIGMLGDKEIDATLSALSPLAASWICLAPRSPRSLAPVDLATQIAKVSSAPVHIASSLAQALVAPPPLLVCGSLFLVGDALAHFQNEPKARTTTQ
ncbi:MAG: folylpolyglutamate synthase/dihydrofolate synthase family protein [Chthoniobacterales bacterium]